MKTKRDILTLPNKVLREKSKSIKHVDEMVLKLIDSMKKVGLNWEESRDFEVCVGLAAIQIGLPIKVVIVRTEETEKREFDVLINPKIVKTYGELTVDFEGCLSVKDIYGLVPRYTKIKIQALNEDGKIIRVIAEGFKARLIQHEIDHTKGILFVDHIKDVEDAFHFINKEGKIERIGYDEVVSAGVFR